MLLQFKFKAGLPLGLVLNDCGCCTAEEDQGGCGNGDHAVGVSVKEIICGGLVFLDGQMRVGDVVLEVNGAAPANGKEATRLMEEASGTVCLTVRRREPAQPVSTAERHSQSAEEVSLAPASPTDCSAVLNSSKMSHSRSFDLLLTTPERGPESLWFEAGDCTDLASQCQRGGQQLQHDRAVSLPAEATAVAMPAASLMPPSSTSSRPTSWHEEPPPQQPQRQRQSPPPPPLPARSSQPLPQQLARKFSVQLPLRSQQQPQKQQPPPLPPHQRNPQHQRHGSLMVPTMQQIQQTHRALRVAQDDQQGGFLAFQALRSGGPSRRGPLIARASDPDVAATIQAAVAAAAGSSPPEVARRGSADDLLDSPSDDNNDTGENGGGVVEILDGVHGGGGPAEDEEDDDATIVEDESTAAPLQQLSRSAMVNRSPNSLDDAPSAASITAAAAPPARPPRRRSFGPLSASYPSPQPPAQTAPSSRSRPAAQPLASLSAAANGQAEPGTTIPRDKYAQQIRRAQMSLPRSVSGAKPPSPSAAASASASAGAAGTPPPAVPPRRGARDSARIENRDSQYGLQQQQHRHTLSSPPPRSALFTAGGVGSGGISRLVASPSLQLPLSGSGGPAVMQQPPAGAPSGSLANAEVINERQIPNVREFVSSFERSGGGNPRVRGGAAAPETPRGHVSDLSRRFERSGNGNNKNGASPSSFRDLRHAFDQELRSAARSAASEAPPTTAAATTVTTARPASSDFGGSALSTSPLPTSSAASAPPTPSDSAPAPSPAPNSAAPDDLSTPPPPDVSTLPLKQPQTPQPPPPQPSTSNSPQQSAKRRSQQNGDSGAVTSPAPGAANTAPLATLDSSEDDTDVETAAGANGSAAIIASAASLSTPTPTTSPVSTPTSPTALGLASPYWQQPMLIALERQRRAAAEAAAAAAAVVDAAGADADTDLDAEELARRREQLSESISEKLGQLRLSRSELRDELAALDAELRGRWRGLLAERGCDATELDAFDRYVARVGPMVRLRCQLDRRRLRIEHALDSAPADPDDPERRELARRGAELDAKLAEADRLGESAMRNQRALLAALDRRLEGRELRECRSALELRLSLAGEEEAMRDRLDCAEEQLEALQQLQQAGGPAS
ncbi:hypothetical protein BOX15_Mlig010258g1 [Macrostomum lignano]|uniref:PDZ domain-containing protein n=1 Tax=Macrostomum lignano TaxID=282301 RepID=A0A267ETL1_9PLAT|nr:hypothetical protein BOX15_Mlig010258g1 [Macrostomum lignano]